MPVGPPTENRWNALLRIARAWRLEWNADVLLGRAVREAVDLLQLDHGAVFLLERTGLATRALWPEPDPTAAENLLSVARTIAQEVVHSGRPLQAHAAAKESGSALQEVCCVPLTAGRGVMGAFYVAGRAQQRLSPEDQEFIEMLALQAAAALEHAVLYQSAITDPLTGLFSHRHFQQEVEQALRRAARSLKPLSLVLMDLDHFKELNDACGHEVGNQCLVQVAQLLKLSLRATDLIARFGGDEFEMLLPDTPIEAAATVCEKIRNGIENLSYPGGRHVGASLGIAAYPDNAQDAQTLFLQADGAMYQAKEAGRNCIRRSSHQAATLPPPEAQRSGQFAAAALHKLASPAPVLPAQPPFSNALEPGQQMVDGHTVVRRLGTGSSGEVLLVRQPGLEREIALKRPLTPHLTAQQMQAFEHEARTTASLQHPGVITVHTFGRDADGRHYYTMQPLSGRTLAEIFSARQEGTREVLSEFSANRLLQILHRAAETLAYAHRMQAVHLDVAPHNIVVGTFGEVTVIDWGSGASYQARSIAKEKSATSGIKLLVGSPHYLAPELLPDSKLGPGPYSDVFSLGAILYQILTGRAPYARANTEETLQALNGGQLIAPEVLAPEEGIAPELSLLTQRALRPSAEQRPSATEFAEDLGRYLRRERAWLVTKFGTEHPLRPQEWQTELGGWVLQDGAWVSQSDGENSLLWKIPVEASFRFVCEAWCQPQAELTIIGRPSPGNKNLSGYSSHVGAEWDTGMKFSRNEHNMMVKEGLRIEPGKRYRLEMEYDDAETRVYCYLDGQLVFSFKDLFAIGGTCIGFYTCGAGAHFRPLELHREVWGMQVPLMRLADQLYTVGQYQAAAERYAQIIRGIPTHLDAAQARLKIGLCQKGLGDYAAAQATFRELAGTPLEGFALAEEASLALDTHLPNHQIDAEQGLQLCRELLQRFAGSPAVGKVCHIVRSLERNDQGRRHHLAAQAQQDARYYHELCTLAAETCQPPGAMQLEFHSLATAWALRLGEYARALDESLRFLSRLAPTQRQHQRATNRLWVAAFANGRDDLLPAYPGAQRFTSPGNMDWCTGLALHWLVRTAGATRALSDNILPKLSFSPSTHAAAAEALLWLASGDRATGEAAFRRILRAHLQDTYAEAHRTVSVLLEARCYDLVAESLSLLKAAASADVALRAQMRLSLEARLAVEQEDFEAAAALLSGKSFQRRPFFCANALLLQVLSGTLTPHSAAQHKLWSEAVEMELSGTQQDLARMCLGLKDPVPGQLWPHPGWRPEWRLWLAIWLKAKGQRTQAREVLLPARDPRYGLTHSQPGIESLLKSLA